MKRFILKILLGLFLFIVSVVVAYFPLHKLSIIKYRPQDKDCVYISGDSQMNVGFYPQLFCDITGEKIISSAGNGNGVYDFLVASEDIPDSAQCIFSFSECALLRNPITDNHRSGLYMRSIYDMYKAGSDFKDIYSIIMNNRTHPIVPVFFENAHYLIPYADTIVSEEMNIMETIFTRPCPWYHWKAIAYMTALQRLYEKGCKLTVIWFPFSPELESKICDSSNRGLTTKLCKNIIHDFNMVSDTIYCYSDSCFMWDINHFNEVGARQFTYRLAHKMKTRKDGNCFYNVILEKK